MLDIILENAAGDQLTFAQGSPFSIVDIEGLNPPTATINTSQLALMDGAKFVSSKMNVRTIKIAFAIEYEAAKNRIEIYKVLKSKQWIKLYYNGQYRQVFIEGYIQSIDISYFAMKQIVTCSILCPSPYFMQAKEIVNELRKIVSAFTFPFASTEEPELVFSYISNDTGITIENYGDVECGMIIEMLATDSITNPKVINYVTGEFFKVEVTMAAGDQIIIDTRPENMTATMIHNGVSSNVFNKVTIGSTWLQLSPFGDTFVYEVGTGNTANLDVVFKHYNLYEGV